MATAKGKRKKKPHLQQAKQALKNMLPQESSYVNSSQEQLEIERKAIAKWTEKTGKTDAKNLTGIALSGGGIRSAVFSLGVLQALAHHDVLKRFDYLSTVSGGGYIGSCLTWWLSGKSGDKRKFGVDPDNFPFGTTDPTYPGGQELSDTVQFLRNNGNYLTPGAGITVLSGVAILLRAIFLNLFVWIPLAAGLFALMIGAGFVIDCITDWIYELAQWPPNAIPNPFQGLISAKALAHVPQEHLPIFQFLIILGVVGILWFAVACIDYAFFTRLCANCLDKLGQKRPQAANDKSQYIYETIVRVGGPVFVSIVMVAAAYYWRESLIDFYSLENWKPRIVQYSFVITSTVLAITLFFAFLVRWLWRVKDLTFQYGIRRFFERLYGRVVLGSAILIIIGLIPFAVASLREQASTSFGISSSSFGILSVMFGVATGIWGHLQSASSKLGKLGPSVVLPIGSALLFFGIFVLAYHLASIWFQPDALSVSNPDLVKIAFAFIFFLALATALLTNINHISPRQYYRDRLMETFLPDAETVKAVKQGLASSSKKAERFLLSDAWDAANPKGPYPIINSNVILVNSGNPKFRLRGGDSFVLTPFYCGSEATGWVRTENFAKGELRLATAMAISGAAANPNAGPGGKGLTRNRFISAVMTLLNLRLGYWVRRPAKTRLWKRNPNLFHPGLTFCVPGIGYREERRFLELSDGGHFENLGIYELIRRKCRLIVVCDGGQDVQASYSDFVTAIRRVEQDFGAEIAFENGGPERMIARPVADDYPKDADFADHGFLWATIKYHREGPAGGPEEGVLIYLKTTMIRELGMKAKGYKGAYPDFPDQTTADQFFDDEQFEAYREVGFRIADSLCRDKGLDFQRLLRNIKT